MNKSIIKISLGLLLAQAGILQSSFAQKVESKYDYKEAFKPGFYTQNGNVYRSASGKPGQLYWQNAASYDIKVSLDDKTHEVKGTVKIHYTNNSPDQLDFIWLPLEQSMVNQQSVAPAVVLLTNRRYGDAASDFKRGYNISNASDGGKTDVKSTINETRKRND